MIGLNFHLWSIWKSILRTLSIKMVLWEVRIWSAMLRVMSFLLHLLHRLALMASVTSWEAFSFIRALLILDTITHTSGKIRGLQVLLSLKDSLRMRSGYFLMTLWLSRLTWIIYQRNVLVVTLTTAIEWRITVPTCCSMTAWRMLVIHLCMLRWRRVNYNQRHLKS